MSEARIGAGAACPWCGISYRPPTWGRDYRCGGCGRPLAERRAPESAPRLRMIALGAGGLLLAGAVGLALSLNRSAPAARLETARAEAPRETLLPDPDLAERLAEKVRFLSEELARAPGNGDLRVVLADHYLRLAVLERDRRPEAAAEWLEKAEKCLRPVQGSASGAPLAVKLRQWQRLEWREGETSNAIPVGGYGQFSARPAPVAMGGPGMTVGLGAGGPTPPRMGGAPGPAAAAGEPGRSGEGSPGGGPYLSPGPSGMPLGGGPPVIVPPSGFAPAAPPDSGEAGLRRVRAALRKQPADVVLAMDLGRRLEQRAEEQRIRFPRDHDGYLKAARPFVKEATRVYLEAAGRAPLRIHQALFYSLAAGAHGKLDEWEEEYRLLKKAAELAPYSARTWERLQTACLRTNRLSESRRAHQKAQEWQLPGVVLPGS